MHCNKLQGAVNFNAVKSNKTDERKLTFKFMKR